MARILNVICVFTGLVFSKLHALKYQKSSTKSNIMINFNCRIFLKRTLELEKDSITPVAMLLISVRNYRNCRTYRLIYSHEQFSHTQSYIWLKAFKNGPSKICGRQPLKDLKRKQTISLQIFQRMSSKNFTWFILEYLDPYWFTITLLLIFFPFQMKVSLNQN